MTLILRLSLCCLMLTTYLVYGQRSALNTSSSSSALFDSIDRDLEEIKNTISKTLKSPRFNQSNRFTFSSTDLDDRSDSAQSTHHFIEDFQKDRPWIECSQPQDGDSIWKFSIPYLNQSLGLLKFREFRGKPLLLVNVATFCESTIEYPMYNDLKDKYGDDLIIIAFPSNQFWNQEPTGDATEIYNAIKHVRPGNGFVPKFPLTERIDVNGENQHRIFSFLKKCCPSTRTRFNVNEERLMYKPKNGRDIRWNFEKFLIDPETGYPVKRYDQKTLPDKLIPDIDALLQKSRQAAADSASDAAAAGGENQAPPVPAEPSV